MKTKRISRALAERLDIITRTYWLSMIPTRAEVATHLLEEAA